MTSLDLAKYIYDQTFSGFWMWLGTCMLIGSFRLVKVVDYRWKDK